MKNADLKKETVKISIVTGITTAGGFVFHLLLGRQFGMTWQLDCFFVVLTLFSLLALFNNFITSLYIPIFNEVKNDSVKEGFIFADVVIKWTALISILLIVVFFMCDEQILRVLAPGFSRQGIMLSKEISHILVFSLVFYSIASTGLMTLNALYHYSVPALIDILDPAMNILALFFLVPVVGLKGIAISYLFTNFIKSGFILVCLYRKTGWRPTARFYHRCLPVLISQSTKMASTNFINSFKDVILRNFASRLGEGAVSIYSYAEKFTNIIVQITVYPLVRVFYSRIAEWVSLSKRADIRLFFIKTLRVILTLGLSVAAFSAVFSPYLLRVCMSGSRFAIENIGVVSRVFDILLIYFIVFSFELCFSRLILAQKRVVAVMINSFLGVIALWVFIFLLLKRCGIYALPLSILISQVLVIVSSYRMTGDYLRLSLKDLADKAFKPFAVAFVLFVAGRGAGKLVSNDFVMAFAVMPVWVVLYALAAKRALKEEWRMLFSGYKS